MKNLSHLADKLKIPTDKEIDEMIDIFNSIGITEIFGIPFDGIASRTNIKKYYKQMGAVFTGDTRALPTGFLITPDIMTETKLTLFKKMSFNMTAFPPLRGEASSWPVVGQFSGTLVILGGSGAGKSEFVNYSLRPDVIIRFGESYEIWDKESVVIAMPSLVHALETAFTLSWAGLDVVIDSIRFVAYNMGGAAGAKGIKSKLFTGLTNMNNFFALTEHVIPVVLNPLVDAEIMKEVYSNSFGSASGAIMVENSAMSEGVIRSEEGRRGVNLGKGRAVGDMMDCRSNVSTHGTSFDLTSEVPSTIRERSELGDASDLASIDVTRSGSAFEVKLIEDEEEDINNI